MTKNEKRAKTAEKAIRTAYHNHPTRIVQEDVTDILADIRHLCDARKWAFHDLDRTAYGHYSEERTGPRRALFAKEA